MTIPPYSMVFWFCVASARAGLLFIPFLTIRTQGYTTKGASAASFDKTNRKVVKLPKVAVDNEFRERS